jgi:hypothetical protein
MKCGTEHRPSRPLVNFAHSGFVNDWGWDDEGKPLALSMMVVLVGFLIHACAGVVPKRKRVRRHQNGPCLAVDRPICLH